MDTNLIVVRQLPVIEDQLRQVKANIETRVGEALSLACTEDTYKTVKKVRAELNREYGELEQRRKEVKSAILAPYQEFEALYKECAGDIYSAADAKLKARISEVESGLKEQRDKEAQAYFDEYRQSLNIDASLVSFRSSGIKITLSESRKAMQLKVKSFLDRIERDLSLIETQECKDEILVEYKRTLDVSQAVTAVTDRHKAMAAERKRREEAAAAQAARAAAQAKVEEAAAEDAVPPQAATLPAPVTPPATVQPPAAEAPPAAVQPTAGKLYQVSFRVTGTIEQLKAMKKFLVDGGYQYEQL